jgi:integrase
MGAKNHSGVRTVKRAGRKILIIDFRFRDKDGREQRCRRDASVQSMTSARTEAETLKRFAVDHGTVDAVEQSPTLERFVRDKFELHVMPTYSPATRERYGRILWKEGLLGELGRIRVAEVGALEFRRLETSVRSRGVQPRQHLILLRRILSLAHELGVIDRMPSLPKVRKEAGILPSAPTREVVEQLISASSGWLRTAIALAFYAGQRSGEVRALRVMDVDLSANMILIRRALSDDQVWTTKGREERAVPMSERLREILAEAGRGKEAMDLLVEGRRGKTVGRQRLYKAFVALQKRAGVSPAWSFHALRHAFGTHAARCGGNIGA